MKNIQLIVLIFTMLSCNASKKRIVRTIVTAFLFLTCLTTFGQREIENNLTEKHQNIKGTKISLIPPKGFTDSLNFPGIRDVKNGSYIEIRHILRPYSETTRKMTKKNLLREGFKVKKLENLTINEHSAIFVTVIEEEYGKIYTFRLLTWGTEDETIVISGVSPKNLKKIGNEIEKSILTFCYDAKEKDDPFESLNYTIDVSGTKLKFWKSMPNVLIFTVDGQAPASLEDKTDLTTTVNYFPSQVSTQEKVTTQEDIKNTAAFWLPIVADELGILIETKYINEITIDGISGYEIYVKGKNKKSGEVASFYQGVLFNGNFEYELLGTTNDETEKSIDEIKKAIRTFKLK